jgi:hypothetical protein
MISTTILTGKTMTVDELIALLQSCDPSRRVVVAGYENGFNNVIGFEPVAIGKNPDEGWWNGEFETIESGEPAVFIKGTPRGDEQAESAEYSPEVIDLIKDMARDPRPTNHVKPDIQTWADEKLLRCRACGWIHYAAGPSDKALNGCFRCGGEAFEPVANDAAPRGVTILPLRTK